MHCSVAAKITFVKYKFKFEVCFDNQPTELENLQKNNFMIKYCKVEELKWYEFSTTISPANLFHNMRWVFTIYLKFSQFLLNFELNVP